MKQYVEVYKTLYSKFDIKLKLYVMTCVMCILNIVFYKLQHVVSCADTRHSICDKIKVATKFIDNR